MTIVRSTLMTAQLKIHACRMGPLVKMMITSSTVNGGTCVDGLNEFTCDCSTATGFAGHRCEGNIDECSCEDPCQNGKCMHR